MRPRTIRRHAQPNQTTVSFQRVCCINEINETKEARNGPQLVKMWALVHAPCVDVKFSVHVLDDDEGEIGLGGAHIDRARQVGKLERVLDGVAVRGDSVLPEKKYSNLSSVSCLISFENWSFSGDAIRLSWILNPFRHTSRWDDGWIEGRFKLRVGGCAVHIGSRSSTCVRNSERYRRRRLRLIELINVDGFKESVGLAGNLIYAAWEGHQDG
ncbi:hypothetical protein C8R44DRAFT_747436 [Mycena epipterygia]|nr:hypothetical protein C8R44DRAFT_747436 [Mycena epipterygia]